MHPFPLRYLRGWWRLPKKRSWKEKREWKIRLNWWERHLWVITTTSLTTIELPFLLSINQLPCSHLKAKNFLELMISLPSLTSYRSINVDTWSAPLIPSPVHPPVAYSSLSAAAFSWPERTTTWDSARLWISLYFTSPIVVLDIYYLYKSSHIYCTLQWHKTKHWY